MVLEAHAATPRCLFYFPLQTSSAPAQFSAATTFYGYVCLSRLSLPTLFSFAPFYAAPAYCAKTLLPLPLLVLYRHVTACAHAMYQSLKVLIHGSRDIGR